MRHRQERLLLCVATLLFVLSRSGIAVGWEQLPGPSGGEMASVFEASDGMVYAGHADGGGVFRSSDGGVTWVRKSNGLGTASGLAFAEASGYVLVGGFGGGVFRTGDQGETWAAAGLDQSVHSLHAIVWPDASESLFAGVGYPELVAGGVHRSDDAGATWTLMDNGYVLDAGSVTGTATALTSIDWGDGTISLFAGIHQHGVYRSDDGGALWEPKVAGLPLSTKGNRVGLAALGTTLFYTNSTSIYRSTDGGSTWAPVTGTLPVNASAGRRLHSVHVHGGSVFASINTDGIYRSGDSGDTWTRKNSGIFDGGPTQESLATVDADVFVAGGAGIYRSTDNGESWTTSHEGIHHAVIHDLLWHGGALYAATEAGVAYSADDGVTWVQGGGISVPGINAIAADGSVLYAAARGWPNGEAVIKSTDDGASWTPVSPADETIYRVVAHGGYVFAASRGAGVFRTSDGGTTWIGVNNGLTGSALSSSFVISRASRLLLAAYDGLYYSDDAGDNWTLSSLAGPSVLALYDAGATVYASTTDGSIYTSSDDGSTWVTTGGSPGKAFAVAEAGGKLFAATHVVARSDDGGATWVSDAVGLDVHSGSNPVWDIEVVGDTLYAATHDAGIFVAQLSAGAVSLDVTSLDFGVVEKAATGSASFVVTNTGDDILTVSDITSSNAQYVATPAAFALDIGLTQTVDVAFTPTVVGWETADLSIVHDGSGGPASVSASGIGRVAGAGDLLAETRIAYVVSGDIYMIAPDGSGNVIINDEPEGDYTPRWSPDGAKVVVSSERGGQIPGDIWVIDTDTGEAAGLTVDPAADADAS
ncbi:DUF1573 domain-containing protein, partial [Candidatus Poribacteria bacterium]|nr:DUF1573 domain-containing protein [Candidatus Poribacteria bacterium]